MRLVQLVDIKSLFITIGYRNANNSDPVCKCVLFFIFFFVSNLIVNIKDSQHNCIEKCVTEI
jgi:hypothetical protein